MVRDILLVIVLSISAYTDYKTRLVFYPLLVIALIINIYINYTILLDILNNFMNTYYLTLFSITLLTLIYAWLKMKFVDSLALTLVFISFIYNLLLFILVYSLTILFIALYSKYKKREKEGIPFITCLTFAVLLILFVLILI